MAEIEILPVKRRDPVSAILVAAAIFITLFICFELFRGLHRYHNTYAPTTLEKQGPAGILTATLSTGGLELSGWAPPHTSVQILDHDKLLSTAVTSPEGNWSATFTYDRHGRNVQILNSVYQDKDKAMDMGRLGIYAPSKSYEDAYVWWDGPVISRLLEVPSGIEDTDLFLGLAWVQADHNLVFAGHAAPGNLIQIYADNEYVGATTVAGDGMWFAQTSLNPDRKNSELRFDDLQRKQVIDRRTYKLSWSDGKDGWVVDWPGENGKKEIISILKPDAGEASPPDEDRPGQVIPAGEPLQNKGIFH